MMRYGLQLNDSLTKAIDSNYKALTFYGVGITKRYKGIITYVDFENMPSEPIVFYRSRYINNVSSPHHIVKLNNSNTYRIYCVGEAIVYVYVNLVDRQNGGYGLEIYSTQNALIYRSTNFTLKPLGMVIFKSQHGETVYWDYPFKKANQVLAYSLNCSAMDAVLNFSTKEMAVRRSLIQTTESGFNLQFREVYNGSFSGLTDDDLLSIKAVSSVSEIPILVVDVTEAQHFINEIKN